MLLPAANLVNLNMSRIYERASEIGIRKAFGAGNRHLVMQFVFENVLLCLVGGVLGFILAEGLVALVDVSGVLPFASFHLSYRAFLAGLGLATFFGILSGIYPAWRMARMHPVLALRGEAS
jgi:putative ABC transport system permease protein